MKKSELLSLLEKCNKNGFDLDDYKELFNLDEKNIKILSTLNNNVFTLGLEVIKKSNLKIKEVKEIVNTLNKISIDYIMVDWINKYNGKEINLDVLKILEKDGYLGFFMWYTDGYLNDELKKKVHGVSYKILENIMDVISKKHLNSEDLIKGINLILDCKSESNASYVSLVLNNEKLNSKGISLKSAELFKDIKNNLNDAYLLVNDDKLLNDNTFLEASFLAGNANLRSASAYIIDLYNNDLLRNMGVSSYGAKKMQNLKFDYDCKAIYDTLNLVKNFEDFKKAKRIIKLASKYQNKQLCILPNLMSLGESDEFIDNIADLLLDISDYNLCNWLFNIATNELLISIGNNFGLVNVIKKAPIIRFDVRYTIDEMIKNEYLIKSSYIFDIINMIEEINYDNFKESLSIIKILIGYINKENIKDLLNYIINLKDANSIDEVLFICNDIYQKLRINVYGIQKSNIHLDLENVVYSNIDNEVDIALIRNKFKKM